MQQNHAEPYGMQGMTGGEAERVQCRDILKNVIVVAVRAYPSGRGFEPFVNQHAHQSDQRHVQGDQNGRQAMDQWQNQHQDIPEYTISKPADDRKETAEWQAVIDAVEQEAERNFMGIQLV